MDKYRPCPSIIAMFTSDSQHPPRSKHAVYLGVIGLFRATSWFDTVNNAVTRWINFRENHLNEHDLQLFDLKKAFHLSVQDIIINLRGWFSSTSLSIV